MAGIVIYKHPSDDGSIKYDDGFLIASNDADGTSTVVVIGPGGMRDLAYRLAALADAIDGRGAQ